MPDAKSALIGWAVGAFLVVPVSYYIVVSQASTDNLIELMANNASFGSFFLIGIGAMLMVFGGAKAALAASLRAVHVDRAIMSVLGAGVSAYLALYFGLEQFVVKYGQVFSAFQFLLSSSRSNLAGQAELIVRYAVVYGAFVVAIVMVQSPLWRWVMLTPRRNSGADLRIYTAQPDQLIRHTCQLQMDKARYSADPCIIQRRKDEL